MRVFVFRALTSSTLCLLLSGCGEHQLDELSHQCSLRRADAFNPNQRAHRPEFLRWSCADTETIDGEKRGQEYCEYFVVAQLPAPPGGGDPPRPWIMGRLTEVPRSADEAAKPGNPHERKTRYRTTRSDLPLERIDVAAFERNGRAVVAQCVFTSWNQDISTPVPTCPLGDNSRCPKVMRVPVRADNFRMKLEVNSAEAAQFLLGDCFGHRRSSDLAGQAPESIDPRDASDDFLRGCYLNAEINKTLFRKSDSILCGAAMRLAECGCAPARPISLMRLLASQEVRGFPLGTWSSPTELPGGCRYVELGDQSRTVVSCDLTASELLSAARDVKRLCRDKYAANVVVHVPIPDGAFRCAPDRVGNPRATSCDETPWVLRP
jgi:hypothetical protein